MSVIFNADDQRRHRLFNGRQIDPTRRAAQAGIPHYGTRNRSRVLMPDDFIPVGPHAGKHLRAIPPDYLLWVNAQPWSKCWVQWQPVADYISRFLLEGSDSDPSSSYSSSYSYSNPVIFVDRLQIWPTERKCFRDGSSHLHCLPGWEDYLHTFALGALALDPRWYQNKLLPHYDLTVRKHKLALECGVIEIPDTQMRDHTRLWKQFRDTPPAKLPL
jgi:hypothetical protein